MVCLLSLVDLGWGAIAGYILCSLLGLGLLSSRGILLVHTLKEGPSGFIMCQRVLFGALEIGCGPKGALVQLLIINFIFFSWWGPYSVLQKRWIAVECQIWRWIIGDVSTI